MFRYETMFVLRPDLEEEKYEALIAKFRSIIEGQKGEVINLNRMGRRRLAYEVNKFREGFYLLCNYSGTANVTNELERNFRITDEVIRYLIVKENE
ncbi:MAG: 30S ribosomal protein S6 [Dethiobacter sp.]|nr:30S ribosomal protein S6 [Dethiobacter sp.]MCL5981008.1 30S ribosomal protein S6 [Bacillota bacterium]